MLCILFEDCHHLSHRNCQNISDFRNYRHNHSLESSWGAFFDTIKYFYTIFGGKLIFGIFKWWDYHWIKTEVFPRGVNQSIITKHVHARIQWTQATPPYLQNIFEIDREIVVKIGKNLWNWPSICMWSARRTLPFPAQILDPSLGTAPVP
jgi:hypothetical protein